MSYIPVLLQLIGGVEGGIAVAARVPDPFVELLLVPLEGSFLSELLVAEVALVIGVRVARTTSVIHLGDHSYMIFAVGGGRGKEKNSSDRLREFDRGGIQRICERYM